MGKPVGPTYMKFMARLNEVAVKTFCFSLTEMSSVTPFDRMTLIAKNFKLIISLQVGCFFSDGNFPVFFLETLNYGRRNRDTNPSIKEVYNRLQCLLSGYQSNNKYVSGLKKI